MVPFFAHPVCV